MRSIRRLYLGSLSIVAPLAVLFACDDGERRVDVVVEVDDPGALPTSPGATATPTAGRASSGSGGSSSTAQGGSSSAPTAGKASGSGGSSSQGGSSSTNGGKSGQGGTGTASGGMAAETGGMAATAACGNGEKEGDEECDDGDTENGDGCTSDCKYRCADCECEACSQTNCTAYATYDLEGNEIDADLVSGCYDATGTASQGPSLGIPKWELCADVVACVRSSGCAEEAEGPGLEAEMCYCGSPLLECLEDTVDGNCKTEFELGAETAEYSDVMERFSDSTYGLGLAVQLLRCQAELCGAECGMKTE